jgi:hypothetical protein
MAGVMWCGVETVLYAAFLHLLGAEAGEGSYPGHRIEWSRTVRI